MLKKVSYKVLSHLRRQVRESCAAFSYIWIRAGQSDEQLKELMLHIVDDVTHILGIPAENVGQYMCIPYPTDTVEYDRVFLEPGNEQQWLNTLPQLLPERLATLGIDQHKFLL